MGQLANHVSGGNVGQSYAGSQEWQDFYLSAQVYIPVDEAVYYGLEFRVDSSSLTSGYQFVARFKPGGMVTERLRFRLRPAANPGMPSVIRDWEAADIPGGIPTESGWHRMAVLAKDHRFWFWFDGQELPGCPITDFSTLKGAIGAYVWDTSNPMYSLFIDDINVTTDIVSLVPGDEVLPQQLALLPAYPNPVRNAASISFALPSRMYAALHVYSLQGKRIATLRDGVQDAGTHIASWDAAGIPAGTYIIRLQTERGMQEQRCTVLR